jgi:hypothetical protein
VLCCWDVFAWFYLTLFITIIKNFFLKDVCNALIFERKVFTRVCGPKYEDGEWESRTNRELEEMSKGENIVKWIKGQRVSWLGHLERMEEGRMLKNIFTQEVERTKRRGRPRKG